MYQPDERLTYTIMQPKNIFVILYPIFNAIGDFAMVGTTEIIPSSDSLDG
jgi:hypothetical protein